MREIYHRALMFAAEAYGTQARSRSRIPRIVHPVDVANEVVAAWVGGESFDLNLAVACALLHDILEDTQVTAAQVEAAFNPGVRAGVEALTKNPLLPKKLRMADSLQRILAQPPEIALVKLADRVSNLGQPAGTWPADKRDEYRAEAVQILETLGAASQILSERLYRRIQS